MKSLSLGAHALSGAVGIVLLASCGGRGASTSAIPSTDLPQAATHSRTFNYTGAKQSFVVPAGVTHITVVARGAGGDSCPRTGRGARVYAVIPVTPGERLAIYVGGEGKGLGSGTGGFNGGGGSYSGYGGGGGASDVRVRPAGLRDRILVAAGGGAAGATYNGCIYGVDYGVGGGGLTGENGSGGVYRRGAGGGGLGGTQTQGGEGGSGGSGTSTFCEYGTTGNPGANGALGVGGAGAKTLIYHGYYGGGGGGGGGGYFGGGGGGGACVSNNGGGGGGGGSSYAEPHATNVQYWPNWKNASGDGLVVFSW